MDIALYTFDRWSEVQVMRYIDRLEACCQRIANHPGLGRVCGGVRPGLRRMECAQHTVFYRVEAEGILVSRILHQSMLPDKHALDDEG